MVTPLSVAFHWYQFDKFIFNSKTEGIQSIITLKEFRLVVACGLIGATSETPKRGRSGQQPTSNSKSMYKWRKDWINVHLCTL